jgi:hypothetical protein
MAARLVVLAVLLAGCLDAPLSDGDSEAASFVRRPIDDVARVAALAEVCPPDRGDDLCAALRSEDDAGARRIVADRLAVSPEAHADPAVRYYLRERIVALLVWNVLTDHGRVSPPSDYAARADAVLATHYPIYGHGFAPSARRLLPPLDGTMCTSDDLLVYYPGVFRTADRSELSVQAAAIADAVPCLETIVIDTGNFVDPVVNAELGRRTLADLPADRRLHLVGYSQGVRNALQLLVDAPDLAARTATMFAINSSAHGSEAIDLVVAALDVFLPTDAVCALLLGRGRTACERATLATLPPIDALLDAAVGTAALTPAERDALAGAAPTAALRALADRLRQHLAGWRSLTTGGSRAFWDERGHELPTATLYTTFRSVITDVRANLPISNGALYATLAVAGGADPYNDMQVRLSNHALAGPLVDREVVMPAAEGNHWQWVMTAGQVPELLMPADMVERIPQTALAVAYVQALFEVGLLR